MDPLPNPPADPQSDWARLLPREAFQEIILILHGALPPLATEDPEGYARRDTAAMMAVAIGWKFGRVSNNAINTRNSRRETEPIAWPLAALAAS